MYEAHKHARVADEDFDKFKNQLSPILKDMKKPEHIIEHILKKVEETRRLIVVPWDEDKNQKKQVE